MIFDTGRLAVARFRLNGFPRLSKPPAKVDVMHAHCTLSRMPGGPWRIHHSSSALGEVALDGSTRDEALAKMRNELQYRMELCPCSGVSLGTIELQVTEDFGSRQSR